ncbi:M15 family metallopeptidase [Arsenicibacter rosenii]|uniref:Peptidase M15C domain-containing protein n=1 Tax=Arsenicibacter rosenii TaxID=1750698 RepID=A0A1S2VPV5_9BACT|nr:M15 family metallopeptidase [Arsenicibacter rosenii]OIN59828.1 hypothetical protein BLX24_08190 [Arsenicibacter rosenii]
MPSRSTSDLHPVLAAAWQDASARWKKQFPSLAQPVLTATYRSREEQDALYRQGRTAPGPKVTNARGGQSPHNFNPSYAFDVAFVKAGKTDWNEKLFREFARLVTDPRIQWGGTFRSLPDMPHFELRGWQQLTK